MAILKLAANPRTEIGSRASQTLRAAGFIPANLYSHGKESVPLKLDYTTWSKAMSEELHLVMLEIPGTKPQVATLREIQRDPLSQKIMHIDLLQVEMDEATHFSVKVEYIGTAKGTKDGGVTQVLTSHVEVECLPRNVPDKLSIDISDLDIGDSLHARQLVVPEGVKLITEPDVALVGVATVRVAVVEVAAPVEGEVVEGEEVAAEKEEEEKEEKE
jgi:large subunit ribosomal protein L25